MPLAASEGASWVEPEKSIALLLPWPFPDLVVRVDHVEGRAPSPLALEALLQTLREVTGKERIELDGPHVVGGATPDGGHRWTYQAAEDEHDRIRGDGHAHHEGVAAHLHVTYLHGTLRKDDVHVFGFNSGQDIFLFIDEIRGAGPYHDPAADRVERAVLIHELGHALELVGCGVPMIRPHDDGSCHSRNEESVMHAWADADVASTLIDLAREGGAIHYKFDHDDLADLAAFVGRGR